MSWVVALVVAAAIAGRVRRGRHVVLTGRFSPRLVRMIVVVLVIFGVGCEKKTSSKATAGAPSDADASSSGGTAAPTPAPPVVPVGNALPPTITLEILNAWLFGQARSSEWQTFKVEATLSLLQGKGDTPKTQAYAVRGALAPLLDAEWAARREGHEPPAASVEDLTRALDEMESIGIYDHWLNAYLWRKTSSVSPAGARLAALYARFYQHARVTDALIAALGQVRPFMTPPRAWMSKAGPRKEEREARERSLSEMLDAAQQLYPSTDHGTWSRDGLVLLTPAQGSAPLIVIRGGKAVPLGEGAATRFGRLDLLETPTSPPAAVEHEWLGRLELPADRTLSVWHLPGLLPPAAKEKLRATISAALDGDEKSAALLERALPLAHRGLRAALEHLPGAIGAPRLRMILALFDDFPMPAVDEADAGAPGVTGPEKEPR